MNKRKILTKILTFVLAVILAVPSYLPSPMVYAANGEPEAESIVATSTGPSISLEWADTEFKDGNHYKLVEDSSTTNGVKLRVSYSNEKVREEGYAAGELVITVKGIGNVNRAGTKEAMVGADKSSESKKERDWSYTWNKTNDTYTFVNNEAIRANSVFSGYFEMVWEIPSRESVHNYIQKDIVAELLLPEGEAISSNTLTFSNQTKCDTYQIDIEKQEMYSYEGLIEGISNPDDYIFIRYNLSSYCSRQSRGVKNDNEIYVLNPDTDGIGSGYILISPALSSGLREDGKTYQVVLSKNTSEAQYVFVAYPKNLYLGKTVHASISSYGSFYEGNDEGITEQVRLATDTVEYMIPADFDFIDIPGVVYQFWKDTYYDQHVSTSLVQNRGGDIPGSKMTSGTTETFYLEGELFVSYGNSYTLDIVDDFLYILQNNGNYRQLGKDEYEFQSVQLPSVYSLVNINGANLTADTYPVKVYAVTEGKVLSESEEELVYEGFLTYASKSVKFPAGTTSFAVRIEGLRESIEEYSLPVTVNFHMQEETCPEEERANLMSGQVINTSFIRVYDKNGDWFNDDFSEEEYEDETNLNLAQKDLETYGAYLDRERDNITFYPGEKSDYTAYTSIEDFEYTGNKYVSTFTMGANFDFQESDTPERFSLYTVLPEGIKLSGFKIEEDIWDIMTLSGLDLTEEELANSCTAEVISDYKVSDRVYVALHFDLEDFEVPQEASIRASFSVTAGKKFFKDTRTTVTVKSAVIIDEELDSYDVYKVADDGAWDVDAKVSKDIDRDGDTEELLDYSLSWNVHVYVDSSQFSLTKSVETDYSDGYVQLPEVPKTEYGSTYSYELSIQNGNNYATDIVILDVLETGAKSEWKGTLQRVDLSDAEAEGLTGTIWYSKEETPGEVFGEDWSTTLNPSKAKAIAIDFGNSVLGAGEELNVKIYMTAPSDTSLKNKVTENNFSSSLTMVDLATGNETKQDDLISNDVRVRLLPELKSLIVTKKDVEDGSRLKGAVFALLEKDTGKEISKATTNANGQAVFREIPSDVAYILREISPPKGYQAVADQEILFGTDRVLRITLEDARVLGTIVVVKQNNLDSKLRVEDAEFSLYDSEGNLLTTAITDMNGEARFSNLPWGTYFVKETKAPDGYFLNDKEFSVTITRDNSDTIQRFHVVNDQGEASVTFYKYEKTTSGVQTTNPVSGALFRLIRVTKGQNTILGDYVTDTNGEIKLVELAYGDYIFRETRVPSGYEALADVEFTISPENPNPTVTAYNQRRAGTLFVYKKDNLGNSIEGAVFELYDETKNNVLGTFSTDANGSIFVDGLEWGTYYVKEKSTPECYVLDSEWKEVVIGQRSLNVNLTIENQTKKGVVVLTKTDEIGLVRLAGAEFSLYQNDGTLLQEGLVTDSNGELRVEGLEWGSYYFKETKAPTGYGLTDEVIRFTINSVNAGMVQSILVENPADAKVITLTKTIYAPDINFDNGDPTFLFEVTGTDVNGKEHTYYRILRFDEDYVLTNTDGNGYVSQSVTVSGFVAGSYTASEKESSRYSVESVKDISTNGLLSGKKVTFDMVSSDEGSANFYNHKYEHQDFSDNQSLANTLKKQAKLTALKVSWLGEAEVTAKSEIDRSLVKAIAIYDDGTTKVLGDTDWSFGEGFSGSKFPNINGEYQIPVSYTERGITKTGSFTVLISGATLEIVRLEAAVKEDYLTVAPNSALTGSMFDVTAVYNDNSRVVLSVEAEEQYLVSPKAAPATEGLFTVTIALNPDLYEEEISTTLTMEAKNPEPVLMKGSDFNSVITGKSIVFTDEAAPNGVSLTDVSEAQDGSVVSWVSDSVMYVSSQRENVHVIANEDCSNMFKSKTSIKSFDFTGLDTSRVKNMSHMFDTILGVSSLDLSNFDTSNVTDLSYMFNNSWNTNSYNLSSFNTSKVTDMSGMFKDSSSSLTILDVSSFDTSNVTDMSEMFYNCKGLTSLNVTGFNTSKVENMANMFYYCSGLSNLDLSRFITSEVTDFSGMFYYCYGLTSLNLSNFNTAKATTMKEMFYRCSALSSLNISSFVTTNVTDMNSMFTNCAFTSLDISNFDTQNVTDMGSMFSLCSKLQSLDLSKFVTSKVEIMSYMFSSCSSLSSLNVGSFNTGKVNTMAGMFTGCYKLTELDLSNFNTSNVEYMNDMFDSCSGLTYLDLSSFNTEKVTTMSDMFRDMSKLTGVNISSFNTPLLSNVQYMFDGCSSLLEIDVSQLDTSKCDKFNGFLAGCSSLKELDLSGFETDSATSFYYMFDGCTGLTELDLSSFDTENLTTTSFMFRDCKNLMKIDFSSFSTENLSVAWSMFKNCSSLTKIDLRTFDTSSLSDVDDMFIGCDAATVGYARDMYSAELFNNSSNKPANLVFISTATQINLSVVNQCSSEVTVTVPDVVEAGITKIVVDAISDTKLVQSFRVDGVLIEGDTFTVPMVSGTVTVSDVVLIDCIVIESEHNPYPNSMNSKNSDGTVGTVYGEAEFDGATSLKIVLDYQTESTSYDWIYLYDGDGNIVNNQKYGGNTRTTETIVVTGNYVKILFKTDSSGNGYYGFKAVITPNYE